MKSDRGLRGILGIASTKVLRWETLIDSRKASEGQCSWGRESKRRVVEEVVCFDHIQSLEVFNRWVTLSHCPQRSQAIGNINTKQKSHIPMLVPFASHETF